MAGENQSQDTSMEDAFRAQYKPMIVYMSATIFFALFGNLFLSCAILRRASRQNKSLNPVQILILHTCLADMLFALVTIFPKLCSIITAPFFYGGDVVCKLVMYFQIVPMWASPFLLVAMSADRYQAICNTMSAIRRNKRKMAHTLAGVSWGLALVAPTPQLFIFRFVPHHNSSDCSAYFPQPWQGKIYMVWFSIGAWLLPSLASAYFYVHVCRQVRQSTSCVKSSIATPELRGRDKERFSFNDTGQKYVQRLRDSGNRRRLALLVEKQRGKTVKLTLTIVVCNFLLWAPFCIINLIHIFNATLMDPVISTYIMLVGNLNSCVNPWIYLFFNRSQIISLICCRENMERTNNNRNSCARRSLQLEYSDSPRLSLSLCQDHSYRDVLLRSRKKRAASLAESQFSGFL